MPQQTLYQQIKAIATQHPELLQAYREDLTTHDRARLRTAEVGDEFLWILRDAGTEMFHLFQGTAPEWATYWLTEGAGPSSVSRTLAFHLRVTEPASRGVVRQISHQEAIQLAESLAPEPNAHLACPT